MPGLQLLPLLSYKRKTNRKEGGGAVKITPPAPTQIRVNMQWSYQLLFRSYHEYTEYTINFLSPYLLEIDQAQLKNLNYSVILSAWLVSMAICPQGISIFI